MIDKPNDLWVCNSLDGRVKVEYVIVVPVNNGIGIILFGLVNGELRQLTGRIEKGDSSHD